MTWTIFFLMQWFTYKMLLCTDQKDGEMYEVVEMPPEEEEELKESEEKEQTTAPTGLVKVFRFIMKQSYVCALIAMMVSQSGFNWSSLAVFVLNLTWHSQAQGLVLKCFIPLIWQPIITFFLFNKEWRHFIILFHIV